MLPVSSSLDPSSSSSAALLDSSDDSSSVLSLNSVDSSPEDSGSLLSSETVKSSFGAVKSSLEGLPSPFAESLSFSALETVETLSLNFSFPSLFPEMPSTQPYASSKCL